MHDLINDLIDFFINNIGAIIITILLLTGIPMIIFCIYMAIKTDIDNNKLTVISQETCSPNEMIKRFDSKGKHLVVCNTEQGLVVREVKDNK